MLVEIIRNEYNHPIGWSITGDTPEDISTVNTMRNLQFFGIEETSIRYAGREGGDDENAGTLKWKQEKYINQDQ